MKQSLKLVGLAVAGSLFLGACAPLEQSVENTDKWIQHELASISVPFEWFKKEKAVEKTVAEWATVEAILLKGHDSTAKPLETDEAIVETLEKDLLNPVKMNGFLSRSRDTHSSFAGFAQEPVESDELGRVLHEAYKTPHQSLGSLTLTGIGFSPDGKRTLAVSLNFLNDTEDFLVYPLLFKLNEAGEIESVKQVQKEASLGATPSPLTGKSEWHESVHQEFGFAWEEVTAYPVNGQWAERTASDFHSWLTTAGVSEAEASATAFHQWYLANEGDLSRAKVTGYLHTDENASALTLYEVTYPIKNSEKTAKLTVGYDRGTNHITTIESGSPFAGSQEGEMK